MSPDLSKPTTPPEEVTRRAADDAEHPPAQSSGFRGHVERLLANKLVDLVDITKSRVALLHYYWGNHQERGAVRMSAVCPMQVGGFDATSGEIFQRHLRQFGPHFSLLRWVYFFQIKTPGQPGLKLLRFEMTDDGPPVAVMEDTHDFALHVSYSRELADRLCPVALRQKHMENLHSSRTTRTLQKDFAIALGHAKGLFASQDTAVAQNLGEVLPGMLGAVPEQSLLSFLTALQSARAFLDSIAPAAVQIPHVMDFFCLFGDEEASPPTATLFTLSQGGAVDGQAQIQTQLGSFLSDLGTLIKSAENEIPGPFQELVCKRTASLIYQDVDRHNLRPEWDDALRVLDTQFPFPRFRMWRDCVLMWLTSLICNLRAKVHEGKRLEFWLAAGDRAEVIDSGQFELTWAEEEHISPLAVPQWSRMGREARPQEREPIRQSIDLLRDAAVRVASRENYVWFANGRYALFWDVTSLGRHPIGLLRPSEGNWEWYLEQRQKSDAERHWPELILAFERKDGSGGIMIGKKRVASLADQIRRVEIVGNWISDWRASNGVEDDGADEILSDLIVRIGDDPDAGCSVVFANDCPSDTFMKMGYPWKLWEPMLIESQRRDEIRRFMEMDGATCAWLDAETGEWQIDFQFLLHGDESVISKWIPKIKRNHDLKLRGSGARRWSAAVAASHAIVGLVVVASQDGDIYAFKKDDKGGLLMSESKKPDNLRADGGMRPALLRGQPAWDPLIQGEGR